MKIRLPATKVHFLGSDWGWGDAVLFWSAFLLTFVYGRYLDTLPPIG